MPKNLRNFFSIKEGDFPPSQIQQGDLIVTTVGLVGQAGQAMGVMGLSYSQPELAYGLLEYQTDNDATTRIRVRLDK